MNYSKNKLLLFFVLLASHTCFSQTKLKLTIYWNDSIFDKKLFRKLTPKTGYLTDLERKEELKRIFFMLHEGGYLTADAEQETKDSVQQTIAISPGQRYEWARLGKGNVEEEILNATSFSEKFYTRHIFTPVETANLLESFVIYAENNGYPFATIRLDSIQISATQINAVLNMQKGKACFIDSILIKGNAKIASGFLQRQIGIRKGDKYNESRVATIGKRLREVPFLMEKQAHQIYFSEKYTKLILFVDEKRSNRFDGVLGFLPNETTGKLLITGQLTLKLSNSFNKGEVLDLDWQKLQAKTQNLKSRLQIPFLFKSPFGADLGFKLYKRDTLFTDRSENIGVNYLLGAKSYFKVFFTDRNIALISTRGLETLTILPQYVDLSAKTYGIGFRTEQLDYKFNPRKGYLLDVDGSVGTKTIKRNLKLNPEAYDKVPHLKTNLYVLDFIAELYIPIKKRSTLLLGNKTALIESENLFTNELYRIGGLSTLRGFDEESIPASAYSISKLEYRFLLDQNSFLFLFANHAYYQNKTSFNISNSTKHIEDNPYGFGAGITFETKPGIFSLSYALGKQYNAPISVRSAKIHFGIISTF